VACGTSEDLFTMIGFQRSVRLVRERLEAVQAVYQVPLALTRAHWSTTGWVFVYRTPSGEEAALHVHQGDETLRAADPRWVPWGAALAPVYVCTPGVASPAERLAS
jgi:hypothetical protein